MVPETNGLPDRPSAIRHGFTLIEVLVVVAIIALLISILLPSLARARAQARSAVCLSNLEQQGKGTFMYAHDWKGWLPHSFYHNSIEVLDPRAAKQLDRMLSRHTEVFFCPDSLAVPVRPQTPEQFRNELAEYERDPKIPDPQAVHIGYWWVANPPPPPSAARSKYIDSDNDGKLDDEYVTRLEQRDLHALVISTDLSRQENHAEGWLFVHGARKAAGQYNTDAKGIDTAWKNNLYADGHAASVWGFKVRPRWGKVGQSSAGW
jgi:prepilin-type N-terminal cleavage/methylation domain-containing protein